MGKGNKSVSHVHPITKHMNKLGGNPEIKYDPISHDEKGMGRGGHLGSDSDLNYNGSPLHDNHNLWGKAKQKIADNLTWKIRGGLSAGGDILSQRRKSAHTTVGKALTGIKHTTAEKKAMQKKKNRNIGG